MSSRDAQDHMAIHGDDDDDDDDIDDDDDVDVE